MPSGVRRKAAMKAGRDVTHNRKQLKRAARKRTREEQVKQYIRRNPILAEQWDPKKTMAQNYQILGLARKIGGYTGGEERKFFTDKEKDEIEELERLKNEKKEEVLKADEARIIRDDNGNVVEIIYGKSIESDDEDKEIGQDLEVDDNQPEGIRRLIELSKQEEVKKGREQSEREVDWIAELVAKHGDDYEAMKWDKKLNIYQQTVGDLRKRVTKWKKTQGKH